MAIKILLSKLLGERKMRVVELSRRTSINQNALGKLYNEKGVKGIRFLTINRLCEALNCRVGDLFKYVPEKKK